MKAKPELNHEFNRFFKLESFLNGMEFLVGDPDERLYNLIWVRWKSEDEEAITISDSDAKYITFPNLNVPLPFKKRR